MESKTENWKDVPGFERIYKASDLGKIASYDRVVFRKGKKPHKMKGRVLSAKNSYGYLRVTLCNGERQVARIAHRVIAETHIENPNNYKEVNHINGIKTDNRVENLEWINHSENMEHAQKSNLMRKSLNHSFSKLTICKIYKIKNWFKEGITRKEIAKRLNVSQHTIGDFISGKTYKDFNFQ